MFVSRYEKKFIIDLKQRETLAYFLERVALADPFLRRRSYSCHSIYYDTPRADFFWDHINGERNHLKLRVRTYEDKRAFLEAKLKTLDKSFKARKEVFSLPKKLSAFEENSFGFFCRELSIKSVSQTCTVVFDRSPFLLRTREGTVRLTIDSSLYCSYPDAIIMKRLLPEQLALLEVKSDDLELLNRTIKDTIKLQTTETAFSKYCQAMKSLYQ